MAENMFSRFRKQPEATNPFTQFTRPRRLQQAATQPDDSQRDRTWGEVVKDTGLGIAQGAVNLVGGVASLAEQAQPINQLLRIGAEAGIGPGPSSVASDLTGRVSEAIEDKLSAPLRRKRQELAQTEGFLPSAGKVLTDPALAGQFLAEQVPNLATLGVGSAATAARAGAAAAARGATREVAEQAGQQAARRFLTRGGTAMESGFANVQAVNEALAQPDEVWDANPQFQALLARGLSRDAAKRTLATTQGALAGTVAAPLSYLGARVSAPFEAEVFTRAGRPGGLRGLASGAGLRRLARGAAAEAAEEAVQEGGSQFAVNVAGRQLDPSRGLLEGVPEAAGTGAAIGGLLGGGLAAGGTIFTRRSQQPPSDQGGELAPAAAPPQVQPAPAQVQPAPAAPQAVEAQAPVQQRPPRFPDAPPGSLRAAANAIPDTVVNAAQQAAAAAVEPASGAAPEVEAAGTPAPQPVQTGGTIEVDLPPAVPPWVDLSTGEMRVPTDDEVKAHLRGLIEQQVAAGRGPNIKLTRATSEAWGVPVERLRALRKEVLEDRRWSERTQRTLQRRADEAAAAASSPILAPAAAGAVERTDVGGEELGPAAVGRVGGNGVEPAAGPADADLGRGARGADGEISQPAAVPAAAQSAATPADAAPVTTPDPAEVAQAFEDDPAQALSQLSDGQVLAVARAVGVPLSPRARPEAVEAAEGLLRAGLSEGNPERRQAVLQAIQQVLAGPPVPEPRRNTKSALAASRALRAGPGQVVAVEGQGADLAPGRYRVATIGSRGEVTLTPVAGGEPVALSLAQLRKEIAAGVRFSPAQDREGDNETDVGLRGAEAAAPARAGRSAGSEADAGGPPGAGGGPAAAPGAAGAADLPAGAGSADPDAALSGERRHNLAERARIDAMPQDERDAEIARLRARVDELEGQQRINRVTGMRGQQAFEDDAALGWPVVAAFDLDGFKAINDTVGHSNGDAILRAVARELEALDSDSVRFYHRSGDEFAARFRDPAEAEEIMANLQEDLERVTVLLTVAVAGQPPQAYEYQGIGMSYGLGADYDQADLSANQQKLDRLAAGLRDDPRAPGSNGAARRLRPLPRDTEGGQGDRAGAVTQPEEVGDGRRASDAAAGPGTDADALTATQAGASEGGEVTMQNRDRSRLASIQQMQEIRRGPDPDRLGFSRDPNTGAPMVAEGRQVPEADKGIEDVVVMASGRRVPVRYAVVEATELAASHNADGVPNPAYETAPLKALNNGRTAGLQAAWAAGNADAYRAGIERDTALHGVSREAIQAKRQPVLVRLYDPSMNTGDMGAESNLAQQLGLSPVEQAQTDARALPDLSAITWAEDGSIQPAANANFFRAWFQNLGATQAATMQDAQGRPNAEALRRVRAAITWRAYGDERLLTALVEDTNPDNRNVMNALVQAAPAFARLEPDNRVAQAIRDALIGGLDLLRDAAARGLRLDEAIAQRDMFGRNPDADAAAMFMASNIRSPKRMAEAFRAAAEYASRAELQAATLDLLGGAPEPTAAEALAQAGMTETDDARISRDEGAEVRGRAGEPGEPASRRAAPGDAQASRVAEEQADLFGRPSQREEVEALRRSRDEERNGRTGTGRTDMMAGPGELFAGPRPEQLDIESGTLPEQDIADYGKARALPEHERFADAKANRVEAGRRTSSVQQLDLFVATRGQRRPDQGHPPAVRIDKAKLSRVSKLVRTGQFRSGIERVRSLADAAHILAPLRKSPQERFLILALDADDRPLAVIQHTVGGPAEASVYPGIVLGAVASVPGVASVVFAHNHPSGRLTPSASDTALDRRLVDLFKGSGIAVRGAIIVAPGTRQYVSYGEDPGEGDVTPARRRGEVPIVERAFRRLHRPGDAISDPKQAIALAKRHRAESPAGILLLDGGHRVIGSIPINPKTAATLRTDNLATSHARLMAVATEAAANSVIIYGNERDKNALFNVGSALSAGDLRVLDVIVFDGDEGKSTAYEGTMHLGHTFLSRPDDGDQTSAPGFKRWFGKSTVTDNGKTMAEGGRPLVVYRGEHGRPGEPGRLQTRLGSISFGSLAAAELYANVPNDRRDTVGTPRVYAAYLRIENPVIRSEDDPFIEAADLIRAVGRAKATEIILRNADSVENTGNWVEVIPEKYGEEFPTVRDFLKKHPDGLKELYLDAYRVFDDPDAVAAFKEAGFDGAIHLGNGETAGEVEYKVFDEDQVKVVGEVGGAGRPTTNSNGQPIHRTKEGVRNFWRWFGNSKVVDEQGRPLVVYHGSPAQFDVFDPRRMNSNGSGEGYGFYFSDDADTARGYQREGGQLVEAYLSLQKPLPVKAKGFTKSQIHKIIDVAARAEMAEFPDEVTDLRDTFVSNAADTYSMPWSKAVGEMAAMIADNETAVDQIAELANIAGNKAIVLDAVRKVTGYDGIEADGYGGGGQGGGRIFLAWFPEQIKSATGNRGTFDPKDPNILFSFAGQQAETADRLSLETAQERINAGANLRPAVESALGSVAEKVKYVPNYKSLPDRLRQGVESRIAARGGRGQTAALFDPATGDVYLFTDVVKDPKRAVWHAAHEIAGHQGLRALLGDKLDRALEIALQNPTVEAVAKAIAKERGLGMRSRSGRLLAAEEALAELAAAVRTGNWSEIESRYGAPVPEGIRERVAAAVENFLRRLKALMDDLFGEMRFTDGDVRSLLENAWQAAQGEPSASVQMPDGSTISEQVVFHGTPHTVDRFSLQRIGTGEGAQSFGWGLYFASKREVAEWYRKQLTRRNEVDLWTDELRAQLPQPLTLAELDELGALGRKMLSGLSQQEMARWRELKDREDAYNAAVERLRPKGQLYAVEIPEDSDLLDWDKPLSEQPEKVRAALLGYEARLPLTMTGEQVYRLIGNRMAQTEYPGAENITDDAAASKVLLSLGIPGLRYLDGGSRGAGKGSHNYVIWDEAAIGDPEVLESTRGESAESVASSRAPMKSRAIDQTETPEFKRWFGNSKVVDAQGRPLVVYHGTNADFSVFNVDGNWDDEVGAFFTTDPEEASSYGSESGANVKPAYLSIANPYSVTDRQWAAGEGLSPREARGAGYDGYVIEHRNGSKHYVAFRPEQIKSATGNRGTFDPKDPNILFSFAGQQAETADRLSRAPRGGASRTAWGKFPPAAVVYPFATGQAKVRDHADYQAAKSGDLAAAERLVRAFVTPDAVARIQAMIGGRRPVLVPVLAEEASGRNKIPLAFAMVLGEAMGLPVSTGIVQSVRANHTGASAFHRLAFQPAFDGRVEPGDYLIVDDAVTLGGTLANLRGHIETSGGRVIGAAVLTGSGDGAKMALDPATEKSLRETFGDALEQYLQEEFGFGIAQLTEGEAAHIRKARTLDEVRNRVAQARRAAGAGLAEGILRAQSAASRVPEGRPQGLTAERARASLAELTAHWGDNAPEVRLATTPAEWARALRSAGLEPSPGLMRAEGLYDGRPVVWLNLQAIRNEKRLAQVLAHEALGHYGVENVVGAEQWRQIVDSIDRLRVSGRGSENIRQVLAEVSRRYVNIPGGLDLSTAEGKTVFAKEAIAVMAERGIRTSAVMRVVVAVRRWLRRFMPGLGWSESDILGLLGQADSFLRAGRAGESAAAGAAAASRRSPVFYSALLESVTRAAGAPKKGGAAAWKSWLDGAQRRGEFRQSERDWLGVDEWLASRDTTTREELADFIRANQVQVEEVVLGGNAALDHAVSSELNLWMGEEDIDPELTESEEGWNRIAERLRSEAKKADDDGFNGDGDNFRRLADEAERLGKALGSGQVAPPVRYESFQLPGGENYRELLLTLPTQDAAKLEEANRLHQLMGVAGTPGAERARLMAERDRLRAEAGNPQTFKSSHFDQPNILAHVRFNERTDADGKRVLFIEEIQSDWHQQGRKKGYGTRTKVDGIRTEQNAAGEWEAYFGEMPSPWVGRTEREAYDAAVADLIDQGVDVVSTVEHGLPNAPFKATDEWAMLAFKRMARWAVDNGFDRIAWTTGEQQAERYDLSKQVSKIYWAPNDSRPDRAGPLTLFPKEGPAVQLPKGAYGQSELADVIGKEAADRLLASPKNQAGVHILEGESLKIGGEGMRAFYDKILPAAVNKWAKKFGATVGKTEIVPSSMLPHNTKRQPVSVHSIDVTDAMRDAVLAGQPLFSRQPPAELLADIEVAMGADIGRSMQARAKAWLEALKPENLKDNLRSVWLGALGTNHLTELGQDYLPGMRHYSDILKEMEEDRNTLMQEGEQIAERVRSWAGKNRAMARRLFGLMHEATIDGVDPSKAYEPLRFRYGGKILDATDKNVREAIKAIRQQMRERSGDTKQDMLNRIKALTAMARAEKRRRGQYGGLVARWNELSEEAQEHFIALRDAYASRSEAIEEALAQRIEDLKSDGVPDGHRRAMVAKIREQFETARLQGIYFPLQRFGQFFVAAEKDDTTTFLRFESIQAADKAEKELKARGWRVTAKGKLAEAKAEQAPPGTFVAEVIAELRKANISEKTQDSIYQLYLNALPELSMRKHHIHRKAIPGFDPDALRAFGWNMLHGSHQLAKLRHMHKLEGVLKLMDKQREEMARDPNVGARKAAAAAAILEELNRRHQWIAAPTDSRLTALASSIGFTYYLGLTPAAALVNLTQVPIVAYPVLGAKFGAAKAANALLKASAEAFRTVGNIERVLGTDEERRAFQAIRASGVLERTQAHNLAGIAEGGLSSYNPAWAKAMEVIGFGFHKAEVINRESVAMAAFRLARESGMSFDEAVRYARDAVVETQFDYSNANRARFMQSGAAKVLLMFRQYSLNMTWFLARNLWLSTKGMDPQVRREARKKLAGVLGMTALFSGVLGLPLMSVLFGVLESAAATFGDDDEPFDAEAEFRNFLADMFGPQMANVLATGPVNAMTGADIASRVSLSQLWFRDADRELEGRGMFYHLLEQAAGPMGGILKNALVGKQQIDEGHLWRGVETMLPKALKDGMKSARYAVEGVNNLRGDPLVQDLSLWQTLLQLSGFTPDQVARQYDANRAIKGYEQAILDRRQHLIGAYYLAYRLGDADGLAAARAKIAAFNAKHPEIAITGQTLRRSMTARMRYSQRAESGIVVNPRLEAKARASARFAEGG